MNKIKKKFQKKKIQKTISKNNKIIYKYNIIF